MNKQNSLRQAVRFIMHAVVALEDDFPEKSKEIEAIADELERLADSLSVVEDE